MTLSLISSSYYFQQQQSCDLKKYSKYDFYHFTLQEIFFHYMHFAFHFYLTIFSQDAFSSPLLSIIQTFSMMLGDINYRDAFLEPFLRNELAYPVLSFIQIIAFTMFVPIVLMNLLVSNLSLYFLFVDHLGYLAMIIILILLHLPS